MHSKTITYMSVFAAVLVAAYVAFVGVAVWYAALTNERLAAVRALETDVSVLETNYYSALSHLGSLDVAAKGYATPLQVEYVSLSGEPTLTRANR